MSARPATQYTDRPRLGHHTVGGDPCNPTSFERSRALLLFFDVLALGVLCVPGIIAIMAMFLFK